MLRLLRLIRMLRIFRFASSSSRVRIFMMTIWRSLNSLAVLVVILLVVVLLFSSVIYIAEAGVPWDSRHDVVRCPGCFDSIPGCSWHVINTLVSSAAGLSHPTLHSTPLLPFFSHALFHEFSPLPVSALALYHPPSPPTYPLTAFHHSLVCADLGRLRRLHACYSLWQGRDGRRSRLGHRRACDADCRLRGQHYEAHSFAPIVPASTQIRHGD